MLSLEVQDGEEVPEPGHGQSHLLVGTLHILLSFCILMDEMCVSLLPFKCCQYEVMVAGGK